MIPIDAMTVGGAPSDFDFARTGQGGPSRWAVIDDGGHAIEQVSTDRADYRFPLAIYRPHKSKNLEVTARFKAVAGKIDRAGGLAVRLTSPDNYYVVRANALEDNVRFYRVVQGRREQLATFDTKVASGVWHTLMLRAEGDQFTVSFNGAKLYTARDKTFAETGHVALWTKSDSVTRFDQISIQALP